MDRPSHTLDPADWEEIRAVAHRAVDAMVDLHRDVRSDPVWREIPEEVRERFREAAPMEGMGPEAVLRDVLEMVVPYRTGTIHPRWWGWVGGTGTTGGMVAELVAGAMNQTAGIFHDSALAVEKQLVAWMKELMGFPGGATGVVVGGASVANFVGLAAARDAGLPWDVAEEGLQRAEPRLVAYGSAETHQSVDKALQLLGLGRRSFRRIPVDDRYRVRIDALARAVAEDRAAGALPFAVVGTAGTVNTGAVDDLEALADLCRDEGLWLHVDGAFGAVVALAPGLRDRVAGMERADSLAFDFHKWLHAPYEAAMVLVRDGEAHRRPFTVPADYLVAMPRGVGSADAHTARLGPQLSRGFKALKVWWSLREHGVEAFGRMVRQNVEQARYLAGLVEAAEDLELAAPVELNVVCFRYAPDGLPEDLRNEVNREILMRLHDGGTAVPSHTLLEGRFVLRAAVTNHRSRWEDFDLLAEEVRRLGCEVTAGVAGSPGGAEGRFARSPGRGGGST